MFPPPPPLPPPHIFLREFIFLGGKEKKKLRKKDKKLFPKKERGPPLKKAFPFLSSPTVSPKKGPSFGLPPPEGFGRGGHPPPF